MCDYVIEVKDLELKSGDKYLLKDINWNVKQGEHWLVFGMNGSGKTTLLSILAGFKHKSGGTVKVFGQEFNEKNILEIRKKIGWISSSFFDQIYKNAGRSRRGAHAYRATHAPSTLRGHGLSLSQAQRAKAA